MQGVIAEIGNHHCGDFEKAKKLIQYAQAAGAKYVKMQAIDPEIAAQYGSMTPGFYKMVAMSNADYERCIDYGRTIGIPVFFSIFGTKCARLLKKFPNNYYKISGGQFRDWGSTALAQFNTSKTIVSLPEVKSISIDKAAAVKQMQKMFVSNYLDENPPLNNISVYKTIFGHRIGYSDHSPGIEVCKSAIRDYGSRLIEKHFHLGDLIEYEGKVYRDCHHAANPEQMHELCKFLESYI